MADDRYQAGRAVRRRVLGNDVKAVLLMVAVYAGVPAANTATRIAKNVLKDNGDALP